MSAPRVIAVTGLRGPSISRLVEDVLRWDPVPTVVGIDREAPTAGLDARVELCELDLTDPRADAKLAEILDKNECELLLHAAFSSDPWPDAEAQHELEVLGSVHVMSAVAASRTRRLVVTGSAEAYGARPDSPGYLTEEHPLRPARSDRRGRDRAEVESLLRAFATRHTDRELVVLRPCWIVGPHIDSLPVRYLGAPSVALPLGYDPLMQFLHEDDWVAALERVLLGSASGVFNLAGEGVLPVSTLVRLGGSRVRRWPRWLLERRAGVPGAFLDQLTHPWLIETRRARVGLGFRPVYSTREAWLSVGVARQLESYA